MENIKLPPDKKKAARGCIWFLAVIAVIISLSVIFGSDNNQENTHTQTSLKVQNSSYDGSVFQVTNYLKSVLKDPDSYESIGWGKVTKVDYSGIIDVRNPKLNGRCYSDSLHKTEADISPFATAQADLYIVNENNGWIKFRTFPDAKTEGVFYCWAKKSITSEAPQSEWVNPQTKYIVWNKYRAKNSFGGYDISNQTFYLDKDGNVINAEDNNF